MPTLHPHFLHLAGVVQVMVASANIVAFRRFSYRAHLERLPVVMRQVFLVQKGSA